LISLVAMFEWFTGLDTVGWVTRTASGLQYNPLNFQPNLQSLLAEYNTVKQVLTTVQSRYVELG